LGVRKAIVLQNIDNISEMVRYTLSEKTSHYDPVKRFIRLTRKLY